MWNLICIIGILIDSVTGAAFQNPQKYIRMTRKTSLSDNYESFIISVRPQRRQQVPPLNLLFETCGSVTNTCKTFRSIFVPGFSGYAGVLVPENGALVTTYETLQLQDGSLFETELDVLNERPPSPNFVGRIGAGLGSPFADSIPLFTIAPQPNHFALIIGPTTLCDFTYIDVIPEDGWWMVDDVSLSMPNVPANFDLMARIVTFPYLGLDSKSWRLFWNEMFRIIPFNRWEIGNDSTSSTESDCQLDSFPTITLNFDNDSYTTTIEPRDYVIPGSADWPGTGCTVLVTNTRTHLVLGTPFFASNIVQFDNTDFRVGFCEKVQVS